MRKLSIIIVTIMLGLLLAPMAALAQAPVERPTPAAPVSEAEDMGMPEASGGASLSGLSLLADSGSGALQAGAGRLAAMQRWDGGWAWPLEYTDPSKASPTNTIGPIGMGLAQAYAYTGDADHLAALQKVGTFLLAKTNNFSPPDGYLAAQLDAVLGGTTYVNHVMTNFYGPLAAGTYDRNGAGTLYNTAGYVNLIRTSRASQGIPNLAAWDVGMGLVGAASVGADTTAWIDGTKGEINELDGAAYYDVIGLAGAVYGLAFVGAGHDPDGGAHKAASSLDDLAAILADYQLATGGFTWSSTALGEGQGNETIQETAYAILALEKFDRGTYLEHIRKAAAYMVGVQLVTGGWGNDAGGDENNEVTGEALWGLAVAEPILWVDAPDHTDAEGKAVVKVMLDPIMDVFGFQFTLTYDPTVLTLAGDPLPGNALTVLAAQGDPGGYSWNVDTTNAGVIKVWVTLLDNESGDLPGLTKQSELVRVSFTATGTCAASSPLELVNEILTRKQDGAQISPVTTMGDSVKAFKLVAVSGQVQLQGRASGKWDGATVSLTGSPFSYTGIETNGAGMWLETVACGTYDVYVAMGGYLNTWRNEVDATTGPFNAGKLLGGNADEQVASYDVVELADVVAIARVIGTAVDVGPWYVEPFYPDINGDSTINILDLVLAGINYTEVAQSF